MDLLCFSMMSERRRDTGFTLLVLQKANLKNALKDANIWDLHLGEAQLSPQLLYCMEHPNQHPNFAQICMLASYVVTWVWQTKICSTGISTRKVKALLGISKAQSTVLRRALAAALGARPAGTVPLQPWRHSGLAALLYTNTPMFPSQPEPPLGTLQDKLHFNTFLTALP